MVAHVARKMMYRFPYRAGRIFLFLILFQIIRPTAAQDSSYPLKRLSAVEGEAVEDEAGEGENGEGETGEGESGRGDLRLMWYNVENLFYPSDDTLPGDDEFTPEGVRYWSYDRYYQKLTRLARVIVAAGRWQPPGVVGLCEVESPQVLEDLVSHPILASYHYSYLHREGPDHRGMDVACIFRPERFNPVGWQFIGPVAGEGFEQTREMLHLRGTWGSHDTLELFLIHFISRYRGAGATAVYRREQAARLAYLVDSVRSMAPGNLVVVAGDFNDTREAWSLEPLKGFYSPFSLEASSYKYRGAWSGIDLFLVSGVRERYRIGGTVFNLSHLLVPDLTYGGVKPFRTYEGYHYTGGYSDHLPVLLDISRTPFSRRFEP